MTYKATYATCLEADRDLDDHTASMTPQTQHVTNLVHGVNNTLAAMVANVDLATETVDITSSTDAETSDQRNALRAQFGEVGLALLEARDAARRIRDLVDRITAASASLLVDLSNPKPNRGPVPSAQGARILVTDDDRKLNAALWDILRDQDAFEVVSVADAARRLASGERFDVIVNIRTKRRSVTTKRYETVVRLGPTLANRFVLIVGEATCPSTESTGGKGATIPFNPDALRALLRRLQTRAR